MRACAQPVLSQPWILDIDATVKPIYGRQEGAERGHNPPKPGRPSHLLPQLLYGQHPVVSGGEVLGGQGARGPPRPAGVVVALWTRCRALTGPRWCGGDCGYGNEVLLSEAEARGVPGLFKLRQTAKVKTLVTQMQRAGAAWVEAGEGWQTLEASLRLTGWSRTRRVVLVREAPATGAGGRASPAAA